MLLVLLVLLALPVLLVLLVLLALLALSATSATAFAQVAAHAVLTSRLPAWRHLPLPPPWMCHVTGVLGEPLQHGGHSATVLKLAVSRRCCAVSRSLWRTAEGSRLAWLSYSEPRCLCPSLPAATLVSKDHAKLSLRLLLLMVMTHTAERRSASCCDSGAIRLLLLALILDGGLRRAPLPPVASQTSSSMTTSRTSRPWPAPLPLRRRL